MVETRSKKRKLNESENEIILNIKKKQKCKYKSEELEASQASDLNEESDASQVSEELEESDASQVSEELEASDASDASQVSDASELDVDGMIEYESRVGVRKQTGKNIQIDVKNEMGNVLSSVSKIYNEFLNFLEHKSMQNKKNSRIEDCNDGGEDDDVDDDFDLEISKFDENVEKIFTAEFFERNDYKSNFKNLNIQDIKLFNEELTKIQNHYKNGPTVIDIMKLNIPIEKKRHLLEVVHNLENYEVLSLEYNNNLRYLENSIKEATRDPELVELEKQIQQKALANMEDNYKTKILKSKMSIDNKIIAYQKLEIMESYEQGHSDEFIKYKNWIDTLLSIPFGVYNNIPVNINTSSREELERYIRFVRNTLDLQLSFLENPKDQIINIVSQMIRNPDCNINAIGLYGCKGAGKSAIAESIAKALNRPLRTISLGGESDSSNLTGHSLTYVGSQPGRFVEILKETQTMTPIILIDELDKISFTEKGNEIIGTLIHLTDSTTNSKYNLDKYFSGIEFDLSKVLFIFTYNDPTKIDKILSDRLYKIKVDNYNFKEKLEIANKHLIDNILNKLHLSDSIQFSQDAIEYLVKGSLQDEGMRTIKTKIKIILTRINMLLLTNPNDNIIKLKYSKLYPFYQTLPIIIKKEHIDTFLDESISSELEGNAPPFGMYV